jgi:predicted enzyme related to lactoylglutathione lyase
MAIQLTQPQLDVGLVTVNESQAMLFYRDTLGLPQESDLSFPGVGVIKRFKVGNSLLRLVIAEDEPAFKGSTEGFLSQTGIRYLTLVIANLDEIVAAVKSAGFKVPVDIMTLRPGTRVAQVEDADGNAVELIQID